LSFVNPNNKNGPGILTLSGSAPPSPGWAPGKQLPLVVGTGGFEPPTSCSQSKNLELHNLLITL
jgi:hypothetical protein